MPDLIFKHCSLSAYEKSESAALSWSKNEHVMPPVHGLSLSKKTGQERVLQHGLTGQCFWQ